MTTSQMKILKGTRASAVQEGPAAPDRLHLCPREEYQNLDGIVMGWGVGVDRRRIGAGWLDEGPL